MSLQPINYIQKTSYKTKIDLLLISLEALDLYSLENIDNCIISKSYIKQIKSMKLFIFQSHNLIKHMGYNQEYNFEYMLNILHSTNKLIKNKTIHKLIHQILINENPVLIKKYINKFSYIYNKNYQYYNIQAYYTENNLENCAIINLYIMNKIIINTNISFFINYLLI
uniref:Uncharacterized protein n=1 Tax=Pterothamnion crispum TaxID=1550583 RepID=A0A4D6WZX0_9FLOR|nr:hypothetical protein [Pterothamnion crispum]